MPASVLEAVASAFQSAGIDLAELGLAWGRVLPIVVLVPAFGLRALPLSARAVIGLALAAAIAPGIALVGTHHGEHVSALADELTRGLSVAIAAAVPLWAATMTGGVIDALRTSGAPELMSSPTVEGRSTQLGALLSVLASAIFSRGAARRARSRRSPGRRPRRARSSSRRTILVAGISLAVALGAPVLVASIVVEVGSALIARTASPAQIQTVLAPLRALVVLVVLAVSIDRIAAGLALAIR